VAALKLAFLVTQIALGMPGVATGMKVGASGTPVPVLAAAALRKSVATEAKGSSCAPRRARGHSDPSKTGATRTRILPVAIVMLLHHPDANL